MSKKMYRMCIAFSVIGAKAEVASKPILEKKSPVGSELLQVSSNDAQQFDKDIYDDITIEVQERTGKSLLPQEVTKLFNELIEKLNTLKGTQVEGQPDELVSALLRLDITPEKIDQELIKELSFKKVKDQFTDTLQRVEIDINNFSRRSKTGNYFTYFLPSRTVESSTENLDPAQRNKPPFKWDPELFSVLTKLLRVIDTLSSSPNNNNNEAVQSLLQEASKNNVEQHILNALPLIIAGYSRDYLSVERLILFVKAAGFTQVDNPDVMNALMEKISQIDTDEYRENLLEKYELTDLYDTWYSKNKVEDGVSAQETSNTQDQQKPTIRINDTRTVQEYSRNETPYNISLRRLVKTGNAADIAQSLERISFDDYQDLQENLQDILQDLNDLQYISLLLRVSSKLKPETQDSQAAQLNKRSLQLAIKNSVMQTLDANTGLLKEALTAKDSKSNLIKEYISWKLHIIATSSDSNELKMSELNRLYNALLTDRDAMMYFAYDLVDLYQKTTSANDPIVTFSNGLVNKIKTAQLNDLIIIINNFDNLLKEAKPQYFLSNSNDSMKMLNVDAKRLASVFTSKKPADEVLLKEYISWKLDNIATSSDTDKLKRAELDYLYNILKSYSNWNAINYLARNLLNRSQQTSSSNDPVVQFFKDFVQKIEATTTKDQPLEAQTIINFFDESLKTNPLASLIQLQDSVKIKEQLRAIITSEGFEKFLTNLGNLNSKPDLFLNCCFDVMVNNMPQNENYKFTTGDSTVDMFVKAASLCKNFKKENEQQLTSQNVAQEMQELSSLMITDATYEQHSSVWFHVAGTLIGVAPNVYKATVQQALESTVQKVTPASTFSKVRNTLSQLFSSVKNIFMRKGPQKLLEENRLKLEEAHLKILDVTASFGNSQGGKEQQKQQVLQSVLKILKGLNNVEGMQQEYSNFIDSLVQPPFTKNDIYEQIVSKLPGNLKIQLTQAFADVAAPQLNPIKPSNDTDFVLDPRNTKNNQSADDTARTILQQVTTTVATTDVKPHSDPASTLATSNPAMSGKEPQSPQQDPVSDPALQHLLHEEGQGDNPVDNDRMPGESNLRESEA